MDIILAILGIIGAIVVLPIIYRAIRCSHIVEIDYDKALESVSQHNWLLHKVGLVETAFLFTEYGLIAYKAYNKNSFNKWFK